MVNDPFERGVASGKSTIANEQREKAERSERSKTAGAKVDNLLRPRFEPHGYCVSKDQNGNFAISIYPFSIDNSGEFSVVPHGYDEDYYVQHSYTSDSVSELDCDLNRVMELAGEYFGQTIDALRKMTNAR